MCFAWRKIYKNVLHKPTVVLSNVISLLRIFFGKKMRGGDESLSKISSYDNTLFVSQLKYVTIYLLVDFQASY